MRRVRTAVLISGTGSNMEALIRASADPAYPAAVELVISNVPNAAGLSKARALGVEAIAIDHKDFATRAAFEAVVDTALRERGVELVALAGFMRVLTPDFVEGWTQRMVNIHPSLLPRHKGLHTHRRALDAGDSEHGASVHWVTPELDSGAMISQARLKVTPAHTEASLRADVQRLEHALYPEALAQAAAVVAEGKLSPRSRRR